MISQLSYFDKATRIIKSCTCALQLPAAERVVHLYDRLQTHFSAKDPDYDHEWHIYTLLAELKACNKMIVNR